VSGNIQSAIPYDDGEVDGTAVFYFDDEQHTVKAEVDFDEDVLDGDYKEFYSNGRKKALLSIDDGLLDGDALFYYRNGQIKIEGRYKNGLRHGKWKHYTKSGDLLNKASWRKGEE
jgi:antitoxin component YwqK of YwqJK toxin-antitoxin module